MESHTGYHPTYSGYEYQRKYGEVIPSASQEEAYIVRLHRSSVVSRPTNNNLLWSMTFPTAPTGSGKTVIFELAIIRMLSNAESPNNVKCIYVAPTKVTSFRPCQGFHSSMFSSRVFVLRKQETGSQNFNLWASIVGGIHRVNISLFDADILIRL